MAPLPGLDQLQRRPQQLCVWSWAPPRCTRGRFAGKLPSPKGLVIPLVTASAPVYSAMLVTILTRRVGPWRPCSDSLDGHRPARPLGDVAAPWLADLVEDLRRGVAGGLPLGDPDLRGLSPGTGAGPHASVRPGGAGLATMAALAGTSGAAAAPMAQRQRVRAVLGRHPGTRPLPLGARLVGPSSWVMSGSSPAISVLFGFTR